MRTLRLFTSNQFACRGAASLALGLLCSLAVAGCAANPQPRVPAAPMVAGAAPASAAGAAPRSVRPTPVAEQRAAVASGDVLDAALAYVGALYAADDTTAALYQPAFGTQLRKEEDKYDLLALDGRPISWGEAGYTDADPNLEFAEVIARVRGKEANPFGGNVYYKVGFHRTSDGLVVDMLSRRLDVRQ